VSHARGWPDPRAQHEAHASVKRKQPAPRGESHPQPLTASAVTPLPADAEDASGPPASVPASELTGSTGKPRGGSALSSASRSSRRRSRSCGPRRARRSATALNGVRATGWVGLYAVLPYSPDPRHGRDPRAVLTRAALRHQERSGRAVRPHGRPAGARTAPAPRGSSARRTGGRRRAPARPFRHRAGDQVGHSGAVPHDVPRHHRDPFPRPGRFFRSRLGCDRGAGDALPGARVEHLAGQAVTGLGRRRARLGRGARLGCRRVGVCGRRCRRPGLPGLPGLPGRGGAGLRRSGHSGCRAARGRRVGYRRPRRDRGNACRRRRPGSAGRDGGWHGHRRGQRADRRPCNRQAGQRAEQGGDGERHSDHRPGGPTTAGRTDRRDRGKALGPRAPGGE